MPKAKNNRKRLFRAALALADMTAEEWCFKEGVRHPVLSMVLKGTRENAALDEKITAFIEKHRDTYHALAS
jgi:hypothetical protein